MKYFFLYAAVYTKLSVSNRNIFVDAHRHCVRHFRVRPEAEAGFSKKKKATIERWLGGY